AVEKISPAMVAPCRRWSISITRACFESPRLGLGREVLFPVSRAGGEAFPFVSGRITACLYIEPHPLSVIQVQARACQGSSCPTPIGPRSKQYVRLPAIT